MDVDYTAYAIIGAKLDRDKLWITNTIKAFPHEYSKDMKFCPTTGKRLWMEVANPIPGYDPDCDDRLFYPDGQYDENVLVVQDEYDCYVGVIVAWDEKNSSNKYNFKNIDLINVAEQKIKLKALLMTLHLWDKDVDESFGLHAFLQIS